MELMVWNGVLTLILGLVGYFLRERSNEISRLSILLNKTREEMAKEYVTKKEMESDINRVIDRLDALDSKIDRLIEKRGRYWQAKKERLNRTILKTLLSTGL